MCYSTGMIERNTSDQVCEGSVKFWEVHFMGYKEGVMGISGDIVGLEGD